MRNYILNSTKEDDTIVTDEAALYGMIGRLPPPELVDTSYVQIKSGKISPKKFLTIIQKYRPKLVIAWNGRLNALRDFKDLVKEYRLTYLSGERSIFILD